MRKWIFQTLAPVLGVTLFLVALIVLGKLARDRLRGQEQYSLPFSEIDCTSPSTLSRSDFLGEVQYLGDLPDRLQVLDRDLPPRLAVAFTRHPWVEKVERIEIVQARRIRVHLIYRTPVLAIPLPDATSATGPSYSHLPLPAKVRKGMVPARVVDGQGILLPPFAIGEDLPVYLGQTKAPAGVAGASWGDPAVEAAARTAGFLRAQQERFRIDSYQVGDDGVILNCGILASRIVWGQAPGAERPGEPPAAQKLQRLLSYCERHSSLNAPDGPYEHDVRSADQPIRRLLGTQLAP